MLYVISISLIRVFCVLFYGMRFKGRENLPKDRGYIICPNHVSALDVLNVASARLWGKRMIILAKDELFKSKFVNWYLSKMGAVAVNRGKGDVDMIENTIEKIKKGRSCLVFPEGTRSKTGELLKLKSGAFVIAAQAQVDIVPCRVIYKGGKPKVFGRCTVIFDKPLTIEEMKLSEVKNAKVLRDCKALLTERLEKLLENNKQYI